MAAAAGSAVPTSDDDACVRAWAESGAMKLTGLRDGAPSVAPAGIARPLSALSGAFSSATIMLGRRVDADALALTTQRSAFTRAARNGDVSVGGSARMLQAADGWIALNLPRDSDVAALPALLSLAGEIVSGSAGQSASRCDPSEGLTIDRAGSDDPGQATDSRELVLRDGPSTHFGRCSCARRAKAIRTLVQDRPNDARAQSCARCDWTLIAAAVKSLHASEVVDAAALLGLAAARVADTEPQARPWTLNWEGPAKMRCNRPPVVVDLTSLWAGPLAGALLARSGCRVIKVESEARSDAARRENPQFFERLNSAKETVTLALPEPRAVKRLTSLMLSADLVLDSSRPRVMQQWGIDPVEIVRAGTAWVSITGYGRGGRHSNRIAFGDDAAVSAGLVVDGDPPLFVADAIADPISGLAAAVIAARLLASRRRALADVSLVSVAAWAVGRAGERIERPIMRTPRGWAVRLRDGLVPVRSPFDGASARALNPQEAQQR